mgnify:CR=1 FL=1
MFHFTCTILNLHICVSGLLKDFLGSYDMAFYFGTIGIVAGGIMMASGNIYIYRQRVRNARLNKQ